MSNNLAYIEPLLIARSTVELVNRDLNKAYLLSQLIWIIKESYASDLAWYDFDAEDVANHIGMPFDWVCDQAQELSKYVFCNWSTYSDRPVIQINMRLLNGYLQMADIANKDIK